MMHNTNIDDYKPATKGFYVANGQKVKSMSWEGSVPKYVTFDDDGTTEKYGFTGALHFVTEQEYEDFQRDLEVVHTLEGLLEDHLRCEEFTSVYAARHYVEEALEQAVEGLKKKCVFFDGNY